MPSAAKADEAWQTILQLRCQREIVERWLASQALSAMGEESLRTVLHDIDEQLQKLGYSLPR